jgi:hypothetical protein
MELDAALEGWPQAAPSAEEVLRKRSEERKRAQEREAHIRKEAERVREEKERDTRERLRGEIELECSNAIHRLAEAGYPGGELRSLVTHYVPARRWFGRRYFRRYSNERASWFLTENWYLSSEGKLYQSGANPHGYLDSKQRTWGGLHLGDLSTTERWMLEFLLDKLKRLPTL